MSALGRLLDGVLRVLAKIGLDEVRISGDDLRRLVILFVTCSLTSVAIVDWTRAPSDELEIGDVAPRTVKAPRRFSFPDHAEHEAARQAAASAIAPVFVHRAGLGDALVAQVSTAFDEARSQLSQLSQLTPPKGDEVDTDAEGGEGAPVATPTLDGSTLDALHRRFEADLGARVPAHAVATLAELGMPPAAQELASDLVRRGIQHRIVADRSTLPIGQGTIHVIEVRGDDQVEHADVDTRSVLTPADAREKVSIALLEQRDHTNDLLSDATVDAVSSIARALIRPNLHFDPLETSARRKAASAAVPMTLTFIKRGKALFREGEELTAEQVDAYRTLQMGQGTDDIVYEIAVLALFLALLCGALFQFGASFLYRFSAAPRDVATVGVLLVGNALMARFVVLSSGGISGLVGFEAEATSVWFIVPVAGTAMLVRLLLGVSWTVMFAIASAVVCGLVMDFQVLPATFVLLSSLVAASAVDHTRERIAVLRAGLLVGLFNAVCVLMFHFLQLYLVDTMITLATSMRPVWSMVFALSGGILSAFLVLGAMPIFESVGFVTDYRMMEMANLNHPLLRQLMLRAPGTYHHSVVVGTLAEAACEAIGANALRAKVAAYFHDIGKTESPEYFVENQRGGRNRHDGLEPRESARIIIAHVTDGGRKAAEHRLPKPILDIIYMHHGTGLLQYFYARALREDAAGVNEADFRYPGPKPDTREAGVVMLADKVEAATRSLSNPTEQNMRLMISRIVNSVMADGQFSECPLTFEEIHTIHETFMKVLLGIYHQRIEYGSTKDIDKRAAAAVPAHATITLEIESGAGKGERAPEQVEPTEGSQTKDLDYESVEHLPGGGR